jgi:simple sugar transport system substrate-binding protein
MQRGGTPSAARAARPQRAHGCRRVCRLMAQPLLRLTGKPAAGAGDLFQRAMAMPFDTFSRRSFLQGAAAGTAAAALGFPGLAQARSGVTIGVVYVGPKDDFGWNQAHAVSIGVLKATPGVKIIEEENVPETAAVAKSMESMINLEGANLILATSFGYFNPFMVDVAKKHPKVTLRHAAPLWEKGKHPDNAGSYFGYLDQAHYVNGVAAGLSTRTNRIGFVAAKPISSVLRNINSVLWGARSVNPNATLQVIFTGDWALPVREAEAANALIGAGCDILTCHVDSPKVVIETAERRGIRSLGHNASQAPLAPKGFITGAEYKWETIYRIFADAIARGQPVPNMVFGGYDKDMVRNTAFGAGAEEPARKAAEAAIADLKANKPIIRGPVKDNKGNVVLPNASYDNFDRVLDGMNFLAEGVVGSIT